MLSDKTMAIIALTLIAGASAWVLGADSETVITACVSGIAGMAVGKTL